MDQMVEPDQPARGCKKRASTSKRFAWVAGYCSPELYRLHRAPFWLGDRLCIGKQFFQLSPLAFFGRRQLKKKSDPKPLQSLLNDVRSRMRILSKNENARTVLLAAGIAAFFALALRYGEHNGQHQTSIPACDSDLCSKPVVDDTPAASNPEQTPNIGRAQSDDKYSQPAPSARGNTTDIVMSRKTGARARVGIAHAARFQAYIDDLESKHGARIFFMGGIRPGRCSPSGLHPCGEALDVCQLRRGVVDPRCHLPPRRTLAQVASSHGLFEGGRWCNSDYGHVQIGATSRDCGDPRTRIVRRQIAPEAGLKAAVVSFE
jgi:hypothetical protein